MLLNTILLGDSVFDNAAYVPGEPSVSEQLQYALREDQIKVALEAVDGSVTRDVIDHQLPRLTERCDAIVVSSGGNDALQHIDLIRHTEAAIIPEILSRFHSIREKFRQDYSNLLDKLAERSCPVMVATIYNPDFKRDDALCALQGAAEAALSFFNDVIVQEATKRGLEILDLREICAKTEDFANPIEPSAIGGNKIAQKISGWVQQTLIPKSTPPTNCT